MNGLSAEVVVLGAGPAGLAAAWQAARRGFRVIVLERADHVGGMAASFDVGGMRVDHGSRRLDTSIAPRLLRDLRELLGDDLQVRSRNSRLRVADRWVSFPLRAGDLAKTLPGWFLRGIARDAATAPFRRPHEDTYADVLRAGVGPTLYEALYGPYAEKLWGLSGDRISGAQARRRVSSSSMTKLVRRVVRGGGPSGTEQSFYYPRRGYGQIVEALADAAVTAGADIRLAAEVSDVRVIDGEVRVATQDGDQVTGSFAYSTLPLPMLARIARPAPSLADMEAASRLRFRAMLLVYVVHKGGRWSPYDAHYLPGRHTPVSRISEPANYREAVDDPPDRSVICVEVPCSMTDEVWGIDDDGAADLVDEALASSGLPPVKRLHVETRRLGQVYPIYRLGFEEDFAGVDAWARMMRRVVTFGRQGLFAHDNTHHALAMAYDAVDSLQDDGSFDRYAWTAARQRYEHNVVAD